MTYSKRQQVLIERLVRFGTAVQERRLPLKVCEVLGFGSFFRGKPNAKDVDLVIRHTGLENQQFTDFHAYVEEIRHNKQLRDRYATPREAFIAAYRSKRQNMFPGFVDDDEQVNVYASWLDGYSWSMLFPRTVASQSTCDLPQSYMYRFMRRNFPNLNIALAVGPNGDAYLPALRTGFLVSIWLPERTDIRANIEHSLQPEQVARAIADDAKSLNRQIFLLQASLEILTAIAKQLRSGKDLPPRSGESGQLECWLRSLSAANYGGIGLGVLFEREMMLNCEEVGKSLGRHLEVASYQNPDAALVEALRDQVKHLWGNLEALRLVAGIVGNYRFGLHPDALTQSLEEFVRDGLTERELGGARPAIARVLFDLEIFAQDW